MIAKREQSSAFSDSLLSISGIAGPKFLSSRARRSIYLPITRRISSVAFVCFVQHNLHMEGEETVETGTEDWSARVLSRVQSISRSRKEDALRRLFSTPSSPSAKAAIAKRFRTLRKKALLSQADLGEVLGICRQSVSAIENCRVWPHFTTMDRFSDLEAKNDQS